MAIQDLPPQSCHDLRESDPSIVHLDVRTPQEFAEGRPRGSINVPAFLPGPGGMTPNPNFVALAKKHATDPEARVILSCRSGGRSMAAAELLEDEGYEQLINMSGGFGGSPQQPGWSAQGLPVD